MAKSKLITYVLVAILIIAGLVWAYQMFKPAPAEPTGGVSVVTNTGAVVTPVDDPSAQFVDILNDIDSIDLKNRLILSNKIFSSLQDFGKAITDRPTGRNNPFAPIGSAGKFSTSTNTTNNTAGAGVNNTPSAGAVVDVPADTAGGDARLDVLGE